MSTSGNCVPGGTNSPQDYVLQIGLTRCSVSGALVAAITDLSFNLVGYTAVFFNDFTTSLLLVMVSRIPVSKDLSTTGLLFYTAALSLPLLGILVAISGEVQGIVAYPLLPDRSFLVSHTSLLGICFKQIHFNKSLASRATRRC